MELPLRPLGRIKLQTIKYLVKNWKKTFSVYEKWAIGICLVAIVLTSWQWASASSAKGETKPTQGGVFIEGVVAESVENVDLSRLTKSGLVMLDDSGQPQPDVATSWQISEDKLTYQFTLQEKINSSEIVDILAKNPTYISKGSATAVSDDKIELRLIELNPNIFSEVSKPLFPYGPYKVSKKKKTEIRLVTNRNYHLQKPYIEKFTVRIYPDQSALQKAADKGSINGAMGLTSIPEKWQTKEITLSKKHILYFNCSKAYLKSLKTREILISGAKPESIKILDVLEVNGVSNDQDYENFKKKLIESGIELKIRKVSLKEAILHDLPKRNYDLLYILVDEGSMGDPYLTWHSSQRVGDGQNFAELANADIDKLTEEYRNNDDLAKKAEIRTKIDALIAKEKVAVEYQNIRSKYAVLDKVKGFSVGAMCTCDAERFNYVNRWYLREKRI